MSARKIAPPAPLNERRSMVIQITPLRACNLRCSHCFISDAHKAIRAQMDEALFARSLDIALTFSRAFDLWDIEIVLMGGELHLLPPDYQRRIYTIATDRLFAHLSRARAEGRRLAEMSLAIISNLVNMPQSKRDIFAEAWEYFAARREAFRAEAKGAADADFIMASSWEPDTNRFYKPHVESAWEENLRALARAGVPIGVAITGTAGTVKHDGKAIVDRFCRGLGAHVMYDHFAPYGEGRHAPHLLPDHDDVVRFLGELNAAGAALATEGSPLTVAPLFAAGRPLEQLNSRLAAILAIDWDGAVVMDSESSADLQFSGQAFMIDNTPDDVLVDRLLNLAERRMRRELRELVLRGCMTCPHIRTCQGGFPHFVPVFEGRDDGNCAGLKPLMDRLYPAVAAA